MVPFQPYFTQEEGLGEACKRFQDFRGRFKIVEDVVVFKALKLVNFDN